MISPKGVVRLKDALKALDTLSRFITAVDIDAYLGNEILRSAVERQLEIVGEALTVFRRLEPEIATEIKDLPRAANLRNFLAHEYGGVDDQIVWDIASVYAPELRQEIMLVMTSKLIGN